MLLNFILLGLSNFFGLLVTDVEMLLGLRSLFIKGLGSNFLIVLIGSEHCKRTEY